MLGNGSELAQASRPLGRTFGSDFLAVWLLVAGVLSLLAFAGAAAWLVMRLREMKAASKPWMPIDAVLDLGEEQAEAVPAKQKL